MAKRLIPSLNCVLIEKIVPPSKTIAGILLPEQSTKLNSGKVVAVGLGARDKGGNMMPLPKIKTFWLSAKWLLHVAFKEGDTVLLLEHGGTQVKFVEKFHHLYRDEDILGTLHD